jgi:hypothetical protein
MRVDGNDLTNHHQNGALHFHERVTRVSQFTRRVVAQRRST